MTRSLSFRNRGIQDGVASYGRNKIDIRDCITNNRFLDFFDGLMTSNRVQSAFYENRSLLRRF